MGKWLVEWTGQPTPAARLICIGHVGAGASLFHSWRKDIPEEISLCAIRLPGRESRIAEPPVRSFCDLLPILVPIVQQVIGAEPFALFGSCSGSLIAFALARELASSGHRAALLGVTAHRAPHLHHGAAETIRSMSRQELVRFAGATGGTDPATLANNAMMEVLEPILRADIELFASYQHAPGPPLPISISLFASETDPFVPAEDFLAWEEETSRTFTPRFLPAEHLLRDRSTWSGLAASLGADVRCAIKTLDAGTGSTGGRPAFDAQRTIDQMSAQ